LDEVEKIGVERTYRAIADSDLRLLVIDASEPWSEGDELLLGKLRPLGSLLIALNKSDLPPQIQDVTPGKDSPRFVRTSALTGEGIHELKDKILALAAPERDVAQEGEFITNLRHQQQIKTSLTALAQAHQAAEQQMPYEMLLLDLYDALRPLDLITGATYADDVLDIIFKTFCVGK
jgi:tRNA modification GTPase